MNPLVFRALFVRVLRFEWPTLAVGVLSASLSLALAVAVTLSTGSAIRNLETNLNTLSQQGWIGPVRAHSAAAQSAVAALARTHPYRSQWTLRATLGRRAVTLSVPAVAQGKAQLFAPEKCASGIFILEGRQLDFESKPAETTPNCAVLVFLPDASTAKALSLESRTREIFFQINSNEPDFEQRLQRIALQIPGFEFISTGQSIAQVKNLTRSFNVNLQIMGFISIFISLFMLHHVFSLISSKYATQFAIMHANGIPLAKQTKPFFLIAALLGLASGVLGAVLGLVPAKFISVMTQSTVQGLYQVMIDAQDFNWNPHTLLAFVVGGVLAALAGAALPILRIARIDTARVLRGGIWAGGQTASLVPELLFSVLFLLLFLVSLTHPLVVHRLPLGGFAACLFALALNVSVSGMAARFVWRLAGRSPRPWLMQLRIFAAPKNIVLIQVLTLGFALSIGVRSMVESFRLTLDEWSQTTLRADIWVRSREGGRQPLPADVVSALTRMENNGEALVDGLQSFSAELPGRSSAQPALPVALAFSDMSVQSQIKPLDVLNGTDQRLASAKIHDIARTCQGTEKNPCAAYISEALQIHSGSLEKDGLMDVRAQGRVITFRVLGVYRDFGNDQGAVLSDKAVVERLLEEKWRPAIMNIYATDRGAATSIYENLRRQFSPDKNYAFDIITLAELRTRVMEGFEQTFRVTDSLYLLCILISFVTVLTTLRLQFLMRRLEWNVLWASGMDARTLVRRIALWAGHTSLFAAVFSVLGGWLIAYVLVTVVNYHSFGYSLAFHFPVRTVFAIAAAAWFTGALGGFVLARGLGKELSAKNLNIE